MDEIYSVTLEGRQVGSARIRREGLYCRVNCTCEIGEGKVSTLYAAGHGETLRLGIPAPKNGSLCLETKIPAKRFPQKIDEIYLLEKGKEKQSDGFLLKEGESVSGLENLMQSKLQFTLNGAQLITEDVTPHI